MAKIHANPMPFKFNKSRAGVAVGAGCALGADKASEREKEGERGGGGKDGMYRCVVYMNDKYTWDGMIGVVELVEM